MPRTFTLDPARPTLYNYPRLVRISRTTAVGQYKSKALESFSVASCLRINIRRRRPNDVQDVPKNRNAAGRPRSPARRTKIRTVLRRVSKYLCCPLPMSLRIFCATASAFFVQVPKIPRGTVVARPTMSFPNEDQFRTLVRLND